MADTKVSALTALGGTPATGDRLPVVDVSDTTMAASGTTKYVTYGELTTGLSATGHTHVEADITDLGTYLTDITGESIGDLSDVTLTTPAQGDILYRNATGWVNLPAGTSGQYLQTQGAGANPQWATLAGGGDMAAATYDPATVSEQLVGLTATQTLTNKTLTTPTITLKQGAAPAPTAEGDIQWDTDDNRIAVGDGVGTVTFSNDTTNASTYAAASHAHAASDITSGTLAHERGGIEADISAITTGGILAGTGAGTMGIVSAAGKSDGDVLTLQADGTVAYETPAASGGGTPRIRYDNDFLDLTADVVASSGRYNAWTSGATIATFKGGAMLYTSTGAADYARLRCFWPNNGFGSADMSSLLVYDRNISMFSVAALASDTAAAYQSYITTDYAYAWDASSNTTEKHIAFVANGATLYASNSNGTTQTKTDISSGVTLTDVNDYYAVADSGTNIKFYVNGTLKATHTTNLPSGTVSNAYIGMCAMQNHGVTARQDLILDGIHIEWDAY